MHICDRLWGNIDWFEYIKSTSRWDIVYAREEWCVYDGHSNAFNSISCSNSLVVEVTLFRVRLIEYDIVTRKFNLYIWVKYAFVGGNDENIYKLKQYLFFIFFKSTKHLKCVKIENKFIALHFSCIYEMSLNLIWCYEFQVNLFLIF